MRSLRNLLPRTLGGRIVVLYASNLILFIAFGLGYFYLHQFQDELDDAESSVQLLGEVLAQSVADDAVVGDYDAVRRTLIKAVRSPTVGSVSFIDVKGGVLTIDGPGPGSAAPPAWIVTRVGERLSDVNLVIAVGGRDYGVLRLRFNAVGVARDIWTLFLRVISLAAGALIVALLLVELSLSRWLGGLSRIRDFEWGPDSPPEGRLKALAPDDPVEIREALASFERAGAALRSQRETGEDALATLRVALRGLLPEDDRRRFEAAGGDLLAVAHLVTDLVQEREAGRRTLDAQNVELAAARRRELETGQAIQRTMLLGEAPAALRGGTCASYSEPSQGIDGDFAAFQLLRPDCLELLVGDVMGKGVPAALVGAAVRTAYNETVTELLAASLGSGALPQPEAIVSALHRRLTPRLIELEVFVTLTLYRFELSTGAVRFVNAGHTEGLLLRAGKAPRRVRGVNLPIGVVESERYAASTFHMDPGDALVVYSDGLTEACDAQGNAFGEERLAEALAGAHAHGLPPNICLQTVRRAARAFAGGTPFADDQTAVIVQCTGAGLETAPVVSLDLPWDLARLDRLRPLVATAAERAGLAAEAAAALVLASFEAATNIVRHVPPPFPNASFTCRCRLLEPGVEVELWYLGEPFQPAAAPAPDFSGESEGGFGLYIMEQAAGRVAYESPYPGICCTRLAQGTAVTEPAG